MRPARVCCRRPISTSNRFTLLRTLAGGVGEMVVVVVCVWGVISQDEPQ